MASLFVRREPLLFTSLCFLIYLFKTDLPILVLREINSSDDNNSNNNNKYKDLIIEIQRMRRVKGKVIPEIKRANGTVSKSLGQYLSNIPRMHEIKELQKTAALGTSHILRTALI